jgi:pimeloyl-ACP methyl ester carboxylesterase
MPMIHVNGADIHYTDTGTPPGKPDAETIVFGHGLLFSGWMFLHQVEALEDDYRCITIDWRSQGKSPAARDGHDMDTLTLDLVSLLDELRLGEVHYVGLSMGGFVGMRLAARHPERVRSLVLLDTSAGPEDPENIGKYKLLANVYRVIGIRPVRAQVEPLMFGPATRSDPHGRARINEFINQLRSVRRAGMRRAIYGVFERPPIFDEIGRIRARTLVAVGADDASTPPDKAEAIAAGIDGAKLEVIPDAGHSSTIEQPDVLTRLIREHISG